MCYVSYRLDNYYVLKINCYVLCGCIFRSSCLSIDDNHEFDVKLSPSYSIQYKLYLL